MNKIYIPLLSEGVSVWRPTQGKHVEKNIYRVLATNNYDPKIEKWKFPPGTLVECTLERNGNEVFYKAIRKYQNKNH